MARAKKTKQKKPKKMGRPSIYTPKMVEKILALAAQGKLEREIVAKLGICQATLTLWKTQHPDFSAALRAAKDIVDDLVEESLLARAQGYKHEAVKHHYDTELKEWVTTKYIEHYPPDATSLIFWLKNRRMKAWRDVNKLEHSGEITNNTPQVIVTIPSNGREAK